jgi:hypothetical protein
MSKIMKSVPLNPTHQGLSDRRTKKQASIALKQFSFDFIQYVVTPSEPWEDYLCCIKRLHIMEDVPMFCSHVSIMLL